jgi:GTPase SAR1 family protein
MISNKQSHLDWAHRVSAVLSELGDSGADTASIAVEEAIRAFETDFFSLAILGKAKRGKSTLINALLGRDDDKLAPIDKLPASSAISLFRWSSEYQATVAFREGPARCINLDEVRNYVTEEGNPKNSKGVRSLELTGPFPRLEKELVIVDTPGAGSIHEHHDELLHAYIPQADAVIFLVSARMPLDQEELDLLKRVKAADINKIFFAMNRVDECEEEDIEAAIRHNSDLLSHLGIQISKIHRISALKAFKGNWNGSGLEPFSQEIYGFLEAHKGRILSTRFIARVCSAVEIVTQSLGIQLASASKSIGQVEAELSGLRRKKLAIESERKFSELDFSNSWSRATSDYETDLKSARKTVKGAITEKINRVPLTEVNDFAKQLPGLLSDLIDERLRPLSNRFEEAAREACEKLQTSYPAIRFGDSGGIMLKTRDDQLAVGGVVGGVMIATTGGGLALAGASAAAAIASANAIALAATTTVAAPSILSGVIGLASTYFPAAAYLAPLATGAATVATPAALTTAPLWVALAGPVGWTLAGVGILAIPFSWRLSKLKIKAKLEDACIEQVDQVFTELIDERMRKLREMGKNLTDGIRLRLDRQLAEIENALMLGIENHSGNPEREKLLGAAATSLDNLLTHRPD